MPTGRAGRGPSADGPLDLTGAPWLDDEAEVTPVRAPRARRARPLDPNDPKTWQEVADLTPRLKERLRLGGWLAWHVRKQGHRRDWGREHAGIIEAVPASAGWGVLDWICVPTTRRDHVLWIELKAERGKLMAHQATHALYLARAGQEVVVLRPRHFFGARVGEPDVVHVRLIEHRPTPAWDKLLVRPDMSMPEVLAL